MHVLLLRGSDWVSDLYESFEDDVIPAPPLPPVTDFADESVPPAPPTPKEGAAKNAASVPVPPPKVCKLAVIVIISDY